MSLEEVFQAETAFTWVAPLSGLIELHLIANENNVRGGSRHAHKVCNRNLSSLVDEKVCELALKFRRTETPSSSPDNIN